MLRAAILFLLLFSGLDARCSSLGFLEPFGQQKRTSISSNEALALLTLRHLANAEAGFQSTVGRAKDFGSLKQLASAQFIDAALATGVKSGYRFILSARPSTEHKPSTYEVVARPLRFGITGIRSFHMDERFIIRESYVKDARKSEMQAMVHECGTIDCSEAAAVSLTRDIATAESTYQSVFGRGRTFGTLRQLLAEKLVDPALENGIRNGYLFRVRADPGSSTEAASFEVRATPLEYGVTGKLSFYMDETFVLRGGDKGGDEAHSNDKEYPPR